LAIPPIAGADIANKIKVGGNQQRPETRLPAIYEASCGVAPPTTMTSKFHADHTEEHVHVKQLQHSLKYQMEALKALNLFLVAGGSITSKAHILQESKSSSQRE